MIRASKFQQSLQEAVAHHRGGRLARADRLYQQLAAMAPRHALLCELRGQLALQQGREADGIQHLTEAVRWDNTAVAPAVRLANVLLKQRRMAEAEQLLRHLTVRQPDRPEAWNALGYAVKMGGRLAEAVACHERAVQLNPKFLEGWYHLGLTLASAGRNFRALACHEHALSINPAYAPARFGRAQALHRTYRLPEAIEEYGAFLEAEPQHHEGRSHRLFALQNVDGISREQLFAEHCAYGTAVGAGPATLAGYDMDPARRLRLAILSPDFRTHACAGFVEPLLQHLNPSEFELYLYHDHYTEDAVSVRLRSHASVWRNFAGRPHAAVEGIVRADKPDVLIDLTGHIGLTIRLPIFARRLAPVQITYLGYPDTTGVPAMDFRFTDGIADPAETDRYHTEALVRFAPTAWAYQPPGDAPAVVPPPSAAGAAVTFGCFSSPTKFTDSLLATWARLLAVAPDSRLLLKGRDFDEPAVRAHMMGRMQAQGIPADRVELLPRLARPVEHLACYGRIDIALDTFPYTGTTTTCEALWMGRPVVTRCGNRHAARVGASLLTAIGRPEWIAHSADEYVRIAAELANSPAKLAATCADLRDAVRASELCQHERQARRFAAAVRACWASRCAVGDRCPQPATTS